MAATIPTVSVLTDDEKAIVNRLAAQQRRDLPALQRLDAYYEGEQRLQHIGLAIPPEARIFETVVNVPRMAVDEPVLRQRLRRFYRAGDSTKEDTDLRASWDANNLGSESSVCHTETRLFGRSFVAVGTHPDPGERPLITVESPLEITVDVDKQRRAIRNALRVYRDDVEKVTKATWYRRGATVPLVRGRNGWQVDDPGPDEHGLEVVPLVMFLNRRRAGRFEGVSEMKDVITKTDGIARLVTNMLVGSETHALPARWIAGASEKDFVDEDGKPIPVWEAYFHAIRAIENEGAKFGEWKAGDLENFTKAVNSMLDWCGMELGLPVHYTGHQPSQPAQEGAIRASESRMVVRTEQKNRHDGDSWAWVMGLEERLRTGEWGARNSIRTLWHDPGTATTAEIADAGTKMRSVGALSVEGFWDLLDWDEPRKDQERSRLQAELASDPLVDFLSKPALSDAAGNA